MYNLFVSGSEDAWNGEPFVVEIGRCVREYTDKKLTEQFGQLDTSNINELRSFPCIFAHEESPDQKSPKFGVIREITKRQAKVKIEYEIFELDRFLTVSEFDGLAFELDISGWEMNRTHWALKDVNLALELQRIGIILPNWVRTIGKSVDITKHEFEVALSFPGEVRDYVEPVVAALERNIGPNSYFYDNNYVSQLARPSLDTLLQDIYANRTKLVVVFLCAKYQEKEWCGIEFRAIREIIKKRENDRVMLIRMDDGQVEGVFETDGYVDARKFTPEEIASFIQERVELLPV
jgi:TIR domain